MRTIPDMRLTWDPDKAALNLAKHRVSFDDAASVFRLPEHMRFTVYDLDHADDEDRWITSGLVARGLRMVMHVIPGHDDDAYRIISARLATPDERRRSADHLAEDLP